MTIIEQLQAAIRETQDLLRIAQNVRLAHLSEDEVAWESEMLEQ